MPFSGGAGAKTFTRSDGAGRTGATVHQQQEAALIGIRADYSDVELEDMATAINTSWQKNGDNAATGDIPMGTHKITGLGTPTAATDAATKAYVDSPLCAFSVHKNGSAQSISTTSATKLSFGTEAYDLGALFDSATNYRWTPAASYISLSAGAAVTSIAAGGRWDLSIYKDGAAYKTVTSFIDASGGGSTQSLTVFDVASGSNYYEVFITSDDSSYSVSGTAVATWFQGSSL